MKKYVFIAALLLPTTGAMANDTTVIVSNSFTDPVSYKLTGEGIMNGSTTTECLNTGIPSAGITATSNESIIITADVGCTGSYSPISSGGDNILPTGICYMLECDGTTMCQKSTSPPPCLKPYRPPVRKTEK